MTVIPPKLTIGDRILKLLGKKRGMIIQKNLHPYDYAIAGKESFFKALFRGKNEDLPNGMIDIIRKS